MSIDKDLLPIKSPADRAEEKAEKLALRTAKGSLQEIIDGKDARLAAIDACTVVSSLRTQVKDLVRVVVDLTREVKRLAKVVGGADRE